jgi:polysaccharide biosynthesis protein PslH
VIDSDRNRLHVAILDEEFPFPLNSGKRLRTFHLLSRLARRHRITYLAYRQSDPAEQKLAAAALRDAGITPVEIDYTVPPKSGPLFYPRLLANLASPLPYSVTSHQSKAMRRAIDRLLADDPPDLWQCEWTPYARAMAGRNVPWVVMAHNVESLIWQRYAESESHPLKRWFIRHQWRKFVAFERWAYPAATRAIAVSHEDAALIERDFGGRRADVVENGVDCQAFDFEDRRDADPRRILFLGSLDWRPNIDGVHLILDEIFPAVRQQEPAATLQIVGRKPSADLRDRIARVPGAELHADVPDVRPYLRNAGLLAVPLRIGGGSRLKILEALAGGVPVVTTRVGVEGLRLTPAVHCDVVEEPTQMAAAIVGAIRNPVQTAQTAEEGRRFVRREYDWSGLADRLENLWRAAAGTEHHQPEENR